MSALDHAALGRILDAMPLPAAFVHADGAVAVANRFVAVPPEEPLLDPEAVGDDPAQRRGVDGHSTWTIRQITDGLWLATDDHRRGTDGAIRRFLDGAPDVFVVLDAEFRVLDANAAFETTLGWNPDAVNGVSLWSLVAELPADQRAGVVDDLDRGTGVSIEVTMVCRDGATRLIRWRFESDETHRVGLGVAVEAEAAVPMPADAPPAVVVGPPPVVAPSPEVVEPPPDAPRAPTPIVTPAPTPAPAPAPAPVDTWTGATPPTPPVAVPAPDPFSAERRRTPQTELPDPRTVDATIDPERPGPRRRRGRPAADDAIAELLERHGRVAVVVLELDAIRAAPRPAGVVLPAPSPDDPVRLFDAQIRAEAVIADLGDRRFCVVVPAADDHHEIEVLERRLAASAESTLRANVLTGAAVGDRGWSPATLRTMAEAAVGRADGIVQAEPRSGGEHPSPIPPPSATDRIDPPIAEPPPAGPIESLPPTPMEAVPSLWGSDVGTRPAPTAVDPAAPTILPAPSGRPVVVAPAAATPVPETPTTDAPATAAPAPLAGEPERPTSSAAPQLAPAPVAVAELLASGPTVHLPQATVAAEPDTEPAAAAEADTSEPASRARIGHDEQLRRALIVALERGEFVLRYQPVVALASGRIRGVEALLRWQRPDGRLLGPDAFLDVAEDAGLLVPLGARVIEEAARTAGRLVDRGHTLSVAVNLSSRQLHQPDLVPHVRAALDRCSVDPSRLIVEVTEGTLTSDSALVLARLRDVGVNVAIDDFGVGSSSLGLLRDLPLDAVKLDGSLVTGLETHEPTRAIASAVVSLGAALGLVVVMEGIETPGQADQALRLGCELGQGSLYHWPTELATIERMLDSQS